MIAGAPPPPPENPPVPGRFTVRRVPARDFAALIDETVAAYRAYWLRLLGMFALLFIPIEVLPSLPYVGMVLREALASVAFAGYFLALEAARHGRAPALVHIASAFRLPGDKLVLLVVTGVLPLVCALATWFASWGVEPALGYLSGESHVARPPTAEQLELIAVATVLGAPFWFIQPVCVLYNWSASRSLAANLLACAANWRWVLGLSLVLVLAGIALDSLDQQGPLESLLALVGAMGTEMLLLGFTLVLLRRAIPEG